ncbi:Clavaminate synthase-like protein [Filobasidium floriforme]|uniref:Clavaminate synthase-like protein n=1 Tax=Filobasidium floriforme TaxID=5210 RepID=UPI001E8DA88D|nr:Clavaminate synthase-like protein [Filobasidium floriforme]KAH8083504.1 Clavaminate synthase-like protein [Filobasidium floriforme]
MSSAVTIDYNALKSDPASLEADFKAAFGNGNDALGAIIIKGLPAEFPALRERLLRLADKFASLPEDVREKYARKEQQYMFGWSHGKEVMNGRPDLLKGSYYANPLVDRPDVTEEQRAEHHVYYGENVWPEKTEEGLEGFEVAFKELGRFIFEVGKLVAKACEGFVSSQASSRTASIADLIANSQCNKARLLHYFPPSTKNGDEVVADDDACGMHLDHSILTGLCSAMYLSHEEVGEPKVVPPPDANAGLWICPRRKGAEPVKVSIPADCLAFQTGEALQVLTEGRLAATPHYVTAGKEGGNVSRETFAFFLQPNVDEVIGKDGETFGQFTERIMKEHYGEES